MKKYEIDMCRGPLLWEVLLFSFPLMATYILQLLFNAADLVVIGHYAPHDAMAAIGCTMSMNALVLNIFGGLSVGTNVIVARFFGEKSPEKVKASVDSSMLLALVGGIALMIVGLSVAETLLKLMKTPPEILPLSVQYIRICFGAIPFIMLFNFGSAILRAVGDTRRPLCFLVIAGIVNVVLNLVFVIRFHMGVAGVAWATAASHGAAAGLILLTLLKTRESYHLQLRGIRMNWPMVGEILKIGIPAGVSGSCFALANMLIQSSINSFGSLAMAGNTAAVGLEGIVYTGSLSYHQTALSFVAQNLGGRKFKRLLVSLGWCFVCTGICCTALGLGFLFSAHYTLALFNPDPEVIRWGLLRMKIMFPFYALCGFMDVASGGLRGIGYSVTATMASLFGACVFRIWWVWAVFARRHTMECLLFSYPVSWALVTLICLAVFLVMYRKLLLRQCRIATPWLGMRPAMPRGLRYLGGSK